MNLKGIWEYAYLYCKTHGINEDSLYWWRNLPKPTEITDEYFLEELSWCIYNAGMKEAVIRQKWNDLRSIFQFFDAEDIVICENEIFDMIVPVFNHKKKAEAVIASSKKVLNDRPIRNKISSMSDSEALEYLESYPFIGKITKYHIARNIGFDVVKPDRHLVRIADFLSYENPNSLVDDISLIVNEKKGFIDYILWQWLALEGQDAYINIKKYL
jgi:hypothetical protein